MKPAYDVIVIGGAVAGYAAAIVLADKGHSVAVLDKDLTGPSHLGESLDWETPAMLDRLGIDLEALLEQDEATIKAGAVASHSVIAGRATIGFHPVYGVLMAMVGRSRDTYHVHRAALSRELRARAEDVGVALIEARVATVQTNGDRVTKLVDEHGHPHAASHYIDASGRARVLARQLGIGVTTIGPAKLALNARMQHPYDHRGTRVRLDDSRQHPTWVWDINTSAEQTDVGAVLVATDVAKARRNGATVADLYRDELERHPDLQWALEQFTDPATLERLSLIHI